MSYGHHGIEFTNTGPVWTYTNAKFVNMILKSDGDDLKKMVALAEAGKLKCIIDEHFPFDKVPDALSKSLSARSGGKLIIDAI